MADAHKCDHCGEYYDEYYPERNIIIDGKDKGEHWIEKTVIRIKITKQIRAVGGPAAVIGEEGAIDLCIPCYVNAIKEGLEI